MKTMNIMKISGRLCALGLLGVLCFSCADLEYTEETTRDEEWTYNYYANGIKNLVFDVYAQVYNNEFESNSPYFLAGATDEAQYALETGAVNNYVKTGDISSGSYKALTVKIKAVHDSGVQSDRRLAFIFNMQPAVPLSEQGDIASIKASSKMVRRIHPWGIGGGIS